MTERAPPSEDERREALRAGAVLYARGEFHAAHDPWEHAWLAVREALADRESEGDGADEQSTLARDERLFHGLIQFTAARYHARTRNWSGAVGLADSAQGYLAGLPDDYRGVDLSTVRAALARLEADPERVERAPAPPLVLDGALLAPADLSLGGAARAAEALADEYDLDESVVADAARYAERDEAEATGRSRFAGPLFEFLRADDPGTRRVVYDRLAGLVARERQREADVEGLF